jgi:hypothetical protein
MAQTVLDLYNNVPDAKTWYDNGILSKHRGIESNIFHKWNECFSEFKAKESNSTTAKICNFGTVKYYDFVRELGRRIICIDDVRSVLTNKHKFRVIYTDDDTWLTRDPSFEPIEEKTGENLFSFS